MRATASADAQVRRRDAGARLGGLRARKRRSRAEQPEPGPELDFLEYLGAWAEEDDEWLAIEEWEKDNGAEPEEDAEEDRRRVRE